jgi:ribose-phosphate pyrophosphokinase
MSILINEKPIETFLFSGGECHVRVAPSMISENTRITAYLYSSDAIMRLILAVDAVKRIKADTRIHLTIPYFPYARQDRVCNPGEALSVRVMADLINKLDCAEVTVFDPHSDVVGAVLNRCKIVTLAELIEQSSLAKLVRDQNLALVFPDAGAEKKVRTLAKSLSSKGSSIEVFGATKIRETETGRILSSEVHGNVNGRKLLIVDDICDGGQTFIGLAEALKAKGADEISLYVTHGIFSKGLEVLAGHFKKVYCQHTLLKMEPDQHPVLEILGAK